MLLGLQVEDPVWKTVLTLKTDDEGCAMMDNIDEVTDKRLKALKEIEKDKFRVARAYNKVKLKSFQVGDIVWKTILPLGMKSSKFGKWSPSWEGPYKIIKVISGNSYMMETVQGERLPRAINGRYLKKLYHTHPWGE